VNIYLHITEQDTGGSYRYLDADHVTVWLSEMQLAANECAMPKIQNKVTVGTAN
jgi:hypothetical protein